MTREQMLSKIRSLAKDHGGHISLRTLLREIVERSGKSRIRSKSDLGGKSFPICVLI